MSLVNVVLLAKLKARKEFEENSEESIRIIKELSQKRKDKKRKLEVQYNFNMEDRNCFYFNSKSKYNSCNCNYCKEQRSYISLKLHFHKFKKSFDEEWVETAYNYSPFDREYEAYRKFNPFVKEIDFFELRQKEYKDKIQMLKLQKRSIFDAITYILNS